MENNQNHSSDFNYESFFEQYRNTQQNDSQNAEKAESENKETSEIVYGKDSKKGGEYTWNYVDYKSGEKTKGKKQKKKDFGLRIFALSVAAVFVLSFASLSGFFILNSLGYIDNQHQDSQNAESGEQDVNTKNVLSIPLDDSGNTQTLTVTQIAKKCAPSAVGIMVEMSSSDYFGRTYVSKGVGSGFILTSDGYIATNNHVVKNASAITVVLSDGTKYDATLVGADSTTDIAVVKIDAKNLPTAELGNSDNLVVGELAVAIGTPASIELAGTVTDGIISAVDRKIQVTDSYTKSSKTMTLIQTNATINPGNSGGPLINSKGQVIGINTLKLTEEYEGIGFAIPINGAMKIINQLISDGKVTNRDDNLVTGNVSIGITQYADISQKESEYYGIPQGVLVIQINKSSSATQAGLRRGDIIIKYNDTPVKTSSEINELKNKNKAGDTVKLTIYRDGEGEKEISFKIDMAS